jgi:hypothetical protein
MSTSEKCPTVDIYGFVWTCEQPFVDPCLMPSGTTMVSLEPCTEANPPLEVWCKMVPTHPVCLQAGLPPTGTTATVSITATVFMLVGIGCLAVRRRLAR